MAIQYNENIKIAAPNPLDWRYLSNRTTNGSQLPYISITEVNNKIIPSERYVGLTVNIDGVEYWYKNGTNNNQLIKKESSNFIDFSDLITGGTNLGFFSGKSGINRIDIMDINDEFTGSYYSTYSSYYIDNDGILRIGLFKNEKPRRGYIGKSPNDEDISFVFNYFLEVSVNIKYIGWNIINVNLFEYIGEYVGNFLQLGNINENVNEIVDWEDIESSGVNPPYFINPDVMVMRIFGSLYTGNTITIGGAVYSHSSNNQMHFRSINTLTPEILSVSTDNTFINLSGTSVSGINVGGANEVYCGLDGSNLKFRTIRGEGSTYIRTCNDIIYICSPVYGGDIPAMEIYVTGGSNIGFYCGKSGKQTLEIEYVGDVYSGCYNSLYNNYYINNRGRLCLGIPQDGYGRRGYVNWKNNVPTSFLWSDYFSLNSEYYSGWILFCGDIETNIGCSVLNSLISYYETSIPFDNDSWTDGKLYNSDSDIKIIRVSGSTITGDTITVGGPVYSHVENQTVHLRTITSKTPENIKVSYDGGFVFLSGDTGISNVNSCGAGENIIVSHIGKELNLKTIKGSGNTTVTTNGNTIIICSNEGSGGSGDTYNLQSPATTTVGGISEGMELVGKTSFELFEMLLVPTLYPTITPPSSTFTLSPNGLLEIGCTISTLTATSCFGRGSVSPVYCGGSNFAVGLPEIHNLSGCCLNICTTTIMCVSSTISNYEVQVGKQCWSGSVTYSANSSDIFDSSGNPMSKCPSGTTSTIIRCIEGVYPLFATTSNIGTLSKQPLVSMLCGNNIEFSLVGEIGGKQKFEVPCAWLGSPTNRPLKGIRTFNEVANAWCYQGGNEQSSLSNWTLVSLSNQIQGNNVSYSRYTYNGSDRAGVCIRLEF